MGMEPLISETYAQCYLKFDEFIHAIPNGVTRAGAPHPFANANDEFVKFKLWAGNLGAAHSGRTYELSLDYRLREASFYKQQVLKLLHILESHIEQALSLIRQEQSRSVRSVSNRTQATDNAANDDVEETSVEDDSPWEISSNSSCGAECLPLNDPATGKGVSEDAMKMVSSLSSKSSLVAGPVSGEAAASEMGRLFNSIQFTILCLSRLPIRKPAPLDRLKHRTSVDTSPYQHFDALYVRDKFPQMDVEGAMRLGKMITRRRQLLRYRQTHYENLDVRGVRPKPIFPARGHSKAKSTDFVHGDIDIVSERYEAASSHHTLRTKATTMKMDNVPTEEQLYAPSIPESKSSVASSYTGKELNVEVPPRPRSDDDTDLFECPYCMLMKSSKTQIQWKKHVLEDIQPYVCTFPNCSLSEHFFENRDQWFRHESSAHRVKWYCNENGHPEFEMQNDFIRHMIEHHDTHLTEQKLESSKDMFQRPLKSVSGKCNLCQNFSRRLKSHVSRHLQQMALFALPRNNETEGSEKAELDAHSSRFGGARQDQSQSAFEGSHDDYSQSSSESGEDPEVEEAEHNLEAQSSRDDDIEQVDVPDTLADLDWDSVTDKFAKAREELPPQDPQDSPQNGTHHIQSIRQSVGGLKTVGVCSLDTKARSRPSRQILTRMQSMDEFEVVIFGDKTILDDDVEDWPICDFLLAWYSDGFPLEKAIAYVRLRKPFIVNDLRMQSVLWDRRLCLMILDQLNVPTPKRLEVNRDGGPRFASADQAQYVKQRTGVCLPGPEDGTGGGAPAPSAVSLSANGDILYANGQSISKPFVEKPANGEDHNIIIYFPTSQGGGARRLFRKIGNKSSEFDAELSIPRCLTDLESSFIYEEYMLAENADDVKVYTVGPDYCYAETRKSPVVDGLVRRDARGKELRYVTSLSKAESFMAARIVNGFEQRICKFDVLRTSTNSYVIDINGFSYAKDNEMYYDNCARILRSMFFAQSELDLPPFTASPPKAVGSWKLKGVVAVIRHGDLTPKQSFEFYSASESLMAAVKDDGEVSLEDDEVLASVLQAVTETIAPRYGEFEDALRRIMRPRLDMQVRLIDGHPSLELLQKAVLPEQRVTQTNNPPPLFELSWGGLPLHSLRYQSRDLGTSMRDEYLLLNKALLDDVTVFSGGEKASITSAQIWTTSFLNVQELPEDVIAVRKDLLSDLNAAKDDLEQVRRQLDQSLDPRIEQARLCLEECERAMKRNFETLQGPPGVSTIQARWCSGEDSELFRLRWGLLFNQFPMNFDNLYKISDSYTKMKHDALHNRQFLEWAFNPRGAGTGRRDDTIIGGEEAARRPRPPSPHPSRVSYFKLGSGPTRSLAANRRPSPLQEAYTAVKTLTEYLKPCLYGVTNDEKLRIGLLITLPLLREIVQDLEEVQASGKAKSFIYFTEQSHMYGLFNSIVQGGLRTKAIAIPDFDDLSQICFELWESPDTGTGEDESHKYSAQISVSPGCYTDDPLAVALDSKHVIGSAARMPMTNHVDWKEFMSTLSAKFRKVQLPKALMTSRERDR